MYRSREPINWVGFRIGLIAALFAVATLLLMLRAYRLQVSEAETLAKRAGKQRTRVLHLEARRGMILDRSGEQLAASLEVDSICASPRRIEDKNRTSRILADLLQINQKEILAKLHEDRAFVWILRRVSPLLAGKVKQADLPGVFSVREYRRFYPLRNFASHAIGFAGIDSRGLEGLELYYDKDLKSQPVPVTAQRDALGRPIMFASMAEAPGRRDLRLTLDRNIQYVAEKELDLAVRKERAKSGTAIVMDADTGEILALAVCPTYNLNVFQKVSAAVRRNRAVTDTFEPGSTFKVFLAATALDLGRVSRSDKFYCNQGRLRYRGSEINDIVPYKWLSFDDVLIHSSNIGAVKIAEELSKGDFYRVLRGFGFGSSTGVDLPGERSGMLARPGRWSALTKPNIAFGQGITVNAIQLTAAFAAAVNGGALYRPHLMKQFTNPFGETIRDNRPVLVRKVIKSSTSAKIVSILRKVVLTGTGKGAAIDGVKVIGKTGTAQKAAASGGYSKDKYVASFIGALMGTKPRLVIFVMLDEPGRKRKMGGQIAAPLFRKIAEGVLALCGGETRKKGLVLASSRVSLPKAELAHRKVIRVRKGPRPGEWIVPDLKGLNVRQVTDLCGKIKCDASFRGTGHAVRQNPEAGKIFKEGATLEVAFEGQSS